MSTPRQSRDPRQVEHLLEELVPHSPSSVFRTERRLREAESLLVDADRVIALLFITAHLAGSPKKDAESWRKNVKNYWRESSETAQLADLARDRDSFIDRVLEENPETEDQSVHKELWWPIPVLGIGTLIVIAAVFLAVYLAVS